MSDMFALGALEAAAELGVSVPEDLSIVGFDDGPAAEHATPPLTTVAQPHEEKGSLASRWLMDQIEGGAPPDEPRAILPTELVIRDSTARPRRAAGLDLDRDSRGGG